MSLMRGKTGVIMGVANERSIAWGIAKQLFLNESDIILTYQNENLKKRVEPLAKQINCKHLYECDVSLEKNCVGSIENVFSEIEKNVENIDYVVHALAFSDKDELKGRYINTSRSNFLNTLDIIEVYSIGFRATLWIKSGLNFIMIKSNFMIQNNSLKGFIDPLFISMCFVLKP